MKNNLSLIPIIFSIHLVDKVSLSLGSLNISWPSKLKIVVGRGCPRDGWRRLLPEFSTFLRSLQQTSQSAGPTCWQPGKNHCKEFSVNPAESGNHFILPGPRGKLSSGGKSVRSCGFNHLCYGQGDDGCSGTVNDPWDDPFSWQERGILGGHANFWRQVPKLCRCNQWITHPNSKTKRAWDPLLQQKRVPQHPVIGRMWWVCKVLKCKLWSSQVNSWCKNAKKICIVQKCPVKKVSNHNPYNTEQKHWKQRKITT